MPTEKQIDHWEHAFDDLRSAHANLKALIGLPAEAGARMIYEQCRKKYEDAADALD